MPSIQSGGWGPRGLPDDDDKARIGRVSQGLNSEAATGPLRSTTAAMIGYAGASSGMRKIERATCHDVAVYHVRSGVEGVYADSTGLFISSLV